MVDEGTDQHWQTYTPADTVTVRQVKHVEEEEEKEEREKRRKKRRKERKGVGGRDENKKKKNTHTYWFMYYHRSIMAFHITISLHSLQ